MRPLLAAAWLICLAALAFWVWPAGELRHGPGVTAPSDPVQTAMQPIEIPEHHGWHLQGVALYEITARVLHTRRYLGTGKELVPVDVALGWGRMSDESILDRLTISQSNRFYFYEWAARPPLPPAQIIAHSANVHVIPASDRVETAVGHLRRGNVITLRGLLVNARRDNGAYWNTSLSRTDTGNGACELFYVEELELAVANRKLTSVAP